MSVLAQAQVAFDPNTAPGYNDVKREEGNAVSPYDIILDCNKAKGFLSGLVRGFRTPFHFDFSAFPKTNFAGFQELRLSGGSQFSPSQLQDLLNLLQSKYQVEPKDVYIVDLREETHGHINNKAVTWYYGPLSYQKYKSAQDILAGERLRAAQAMAFPMAIVNTVVREDHMPVNKIPQFLTVHHAMNEKQLAESMGAHYVRLPATDHFRPENNTVDAFVAFVESLPDDVWLHYKCRGGRGRTTTFMALYDIYKNRHLIQLTADDFIARQKALGGIDIADTPDSLGWKGVLAVDRLKFVRSFYDYMHAKDGYGTLRWSDWSMRHHRQSRTGQVLIGED